MRSLVGILCLVGWILYVGQIVSAANFSLAQRLGLQESSEYTDPVLSRVELWAARWDVLWLWTLPAAGVLMLINHWFWPYAAMIGGGAFVDAGGREAAKIFGLKQESIRIGSEKDFRIAIAVYTYLIAAGGLSIGLGLFEVI